MKSTGLFLPALILTAAVEISIAEPPSSFDLRDVDGNNYVTSVKSQTGGTCWTHGAMAAIEGNMLMTGAWAAAGESGEPNLAEYHLDWWNGFNQHNNDDIDPPTGAGLVVHEGGDYRVTSAYLSRGEGAVRDIDGQSYSSPPARFDTSYHYFYVPEIEWFVAGSDLSNINTIKEKIMAEGVMGTCLCSSGGFISNYIHYQPPSDPTDPNHAVAIIGWDDNLATQAPQPGAWLCKNSWGTGWGYDGYFWISYYDKHSCQHAEMGAISFQDAGPMPYDYIYYHDYHGWRDTKTDCSEAFNTFVAPDDHMLEAVSFFTAVDNVIYTVKVYDRFEGGALLDELCSNTGIIDYTGFHTIQLDPPVGLAAGNDFHIYVELSDGGHPYDRTSDVPVLLGAQYRTIVESSADPDQSYYLAGSTWTDLYDFDSTANFCIKGLATDNPTLIIFLPQGLPEFIDPGVPTTCIIELIEGTETYAEGTGMLYYRYDGGEYLASPLTPVRGDLFEADLPPAVCGDEPEFYFLVETNGGHTILSPPDAPNTVYTAQVGEIVTLMEDNFETDLGWTTENLGASSGYWERGVPVNDPEWQYAPAADADGSGQCFVTDNRMGNTDIDGGAVRLTSPILDMSDGGTVSYEYYLFLSNTTGGTDKLLVEASDDSGDNWTEVTRHDTHGSTYWRHHEIFESDLMAVGITLTANMRIRFTANDGDPQSLVEAGIDHFMITNLQCQEPYICGDSNGDEETNVADAVYNINYVFKDGPAPDPLCVADANGDGEVNVADAVYMINFVFKDGPAPVEDCCP